MYFVPSQCAFYDFSFSHSYYFLLNNHNNAMSGVNFIKKSYPNWWGKVIQTNKSCTIFYPEELSKKRLNSKHVTSTVLYKVKQYILHESLENCSYKVTQDKSHTFWIEIFWIKPLANIFHMTYFQITFLDHFFGLNLLY